MAAQKPVRAMRFDQLKIFTGNANPALAGKICASFGCPLGAAVVKPFSDGEIYLQIQENVRGADVFAVQPTCTPVDRHLMELLLMIDALKRAISGAHHGSVTLLWVCAAGPERQAADADFREVGANLLEKAGASRVLALDLHAAQIQGFFDIPVDHLFSAPVMIEYFEPQDRPDMTVFRRMPAAWSVRDRSPSV